MYEENNVVQEDIPQFTWLILSASAKYSAAL